MPHSQNKHEFRHAICSQLINAGMTDAKTIVANAQTLEDFIFSETKTAVSEMESAIETVKTQNEMPPVKEEQTEQAVTKAVVENPNNPQYSFDEVKDALMRVAKVDRDKLKSILEQVGVANVPAIQAEQYAQVMQLAEG